jgi:hypothetical protein
MATDPETDKKSEEVEPNQRSGWRALIAPPVAWVAQGTIGWFIAAHTCAQVTRRISPAAARMWIGAITLIAIAISVGGLLASRHLWRMPAVATESGPVPAAVTERIRFVGMVGLVVCITVTLGLVLAGFPMLLVTGCGEAR